MNDKKQRLGVHKSLLSQGRCCCYGLKKGAFITPSAISFFDREAAVLIFDFKTAACNRIRFSVCAYPAVETTVATILLYYS